MTLEEAKKDLERFVSLKTSMRPAFVDVLLQAEEIRHGHWIEHDIGLICSECNHFTEAMYDEPFNNEFGIGWAWRRPYYCGYCGAKMDSEDSK